jgi:glycosyltransferase involved in cell wall biosynthesis
MLLPHGALEARPARQLRDLPSTLAPVVGSFGFFLPGKGIPALLAAAAALRAEWPALRVRLVNARFPLPDSEREIAACRERAEQLGIADAIEWHTEYLPEQRALDLLAGCDLLVLPYEPTPESASGAVRVALASGVPVAVTPVAIFEDLGDAVARLSGGSPEAIAAGVAGLLRDPVRRAQLQRSAAAWLRSIAWPLVSRRLQGVLRGLAETRRAGGNGRAYRPGRAPEQL